MYRRRGPRAAVLSVAAIALLSLAACSDDSSSTTTATSAALLPRNTVVPVSVVTQYFPDVTKEASTGLNETSVGKPIASRSVVFASADGKKKVTLSVDQYASASDAAAAYQTAVQGSKGRARVQACGVAESGAGGVRRHLAGRRRDSLRSWGTRRQADHVRHARGRHPRHARQLEQPHQPRRRGAHHRQAGPRPLGEQLALETA
jgi:hypothetical protein